MKRGTDYVHNKYNTTFLGVLDNHRPLFYKYIKRKILSSDVLYVEK